MKTHTTTSAGRTASSGLPRREILDIASGAKRQPLEDVVTVHQPGEFTGEINMLSGRASLVQGRMKTPGEVTELDRPAFRKLLATNADLSVRCCTGPSGIRFLMSTVGDHQMIATFRREVVSGTSVATRQAARVAAW